MADTDPAAYLAKLRALTDTATNEPWDDEDDDDCWRLFGSRGDANHPIQLLKAPKHGTPYAEYWPSEADAAFIVAARSAVPRLLAAVEAVRDLHRPGPIVLVGAVCEEHEAYPHFSITNTEADRVRACTACEATVCVSCTCGYVDLDRCPHRVAIATALLSKEDPGD